MAVQVQLRRGTTAQHAAFTGVVGEVTVDTDKDTVVVHDGALAGGFPLPTRSALQAQTATAFTTGGTSTAYTLTPTPAITAYTARTLFSVTFHVASGGAPTLAISGVATPPNLVKQIAAGTFSNIAASDIPINHVSDVVLLSASQALVVTMPPVVASGGGGLEPSFLLMGA